MGAPLPEPVERDGSSDVPGVRTVIANAGRIDPGELSLLLRAHQQRAWRAGQPIYVEAYIKELPGWAADDPEVLELIWCEILLREERGEQPLLAEYELRFPKFGSQLHRLGALQQALRSPSARLESTRVVDDEPLTLPPHGVGARRAGEADSQAATNVRPVVPGYAILGELGRGGMGVVYKARQANLGRLVALKMVLAGVHASPEQLARFRSEAAAVARLQHPNIVPIYEISDFQGNPYYSLEFAEGGSLSRYLDGTPLPPKLAARFIETLAGAIEAAHSQGIIHRDLKPGNVLLKQVQRSATQWLERPDSPAGFLDTRFWTPKITDFGLAKQFEERGTDAKTQPVTHSGAIVGTPCYMPPEQAGGRSEDLGATADVYSLGAILYELLTGRPPFRAASPLDTLLQVISDDPVPPVRLQPGIPRDLNTICLKCLAKEPRERYATAQQLADELHRFLSGRPILARPIPFWVRGMKWARRRPAAALLIVILALSSVLSAVGGLFYWQRQHETHVADISALFARDRYFDQIGAADSADSAEKAIAALDGCGLAVGGQPLRGWEWNYLRGRANGALVWLSEAKGLYCAWRPQDDRIAIADVDNNRLTFWDAREGRQLGNLDQSGPGLAYSPDGRILAVAESSQRIEEPHAIVLLDGQSQGEIRRLTGHTKTITAIAWSRDGKRLGSASLDHSLRIWDAGSGHQEASLDIGSGWVGNLGFTPDGQTVALGQADGFSVWDLPHHHLAFKMTSDEESVETSNAPLEKVNPWQQRLDPELPPLRQLARRYHPVAVNSYGLLAYARDTSVSLWDLGKRKAIATLNGHSDTVRTLAFTADGERLASAGDDRTVRIWETRAGRDLTVLRGHSRPISGLSFAADGRRLSSVALDGTRIWDVTADRNLAVLGNRAPDAAAIDPEGESIAAATRESRLFKASDGTLVCMFAQKPFSTAVFEQDNEWFATGSFDGTIEVWDSRTHELRRTLKGHQSAIVAFAIGKTGDRLASASTDGSVRIWDVDSGEALLSQKGPARRISALALNPEGSVLLVGGQEGYLARWQLSEGQPLQSLGEMGADITAVAFGSMRPPDKTRQPDKQYFAFAGTDGKIHYWDMDLRQEVRAINTTTGGVTSLAFHPAEDRLASGDRLVSGGNDGTVQLWEPLSGHEILRLPGHVSPVIQIRFTRNGEKLLAVGADGTVVTWSGPPTDAAPSLACDHIAGTDGAAGR